MKERLEIFKESKPLKLIQIRIHLYQKFRNYLPHSINKNQEIEATIDAEQISVHLRNATITYSPKKNVISEGQRSDNHVISQKQMKQEQDNLACEQKWPMKYLKKEKKKLIELIVNYEQRMKQQDQVYRRLEKQKDDAYQQLQKRQQKYCQLKKQKELIQNELFQSQKDLEDTKEKHQRQLQIANQQIQQLNRKKKIDEYKIISQLQQLTQVHQDCDNLKKQNQVLQQNYREKLQDELKLKKQYQNQLAQAHEDRLQLIQKITKINEQYNYYKSMLQKISHKLNKQHLEIEQFQ